MTCNPKYWVELKAFFTANLRGITAQEGPALSFVGLNVQQHRDHITVNRKGYIEKLLSKRDSKSSLPSKTLYPLHLNALESLANSVSLPEHALTPAIMELRYLDDVRHFSLVSTYGSPYCRLGTPCQAPAQLPGVH